MYWSKYCIPTLKEVPAGTEAVSHALLLRAGLVHMLTSGVYSYLPLGYRVLANVQRIITEEMDAAGAHKVFLPALQPIDLWKETGRDETLKDVMIRFQDNKNRDMCLGPTHEEVITHLVKSFVQSYKQLPLTLYQIQTKFRDELRTRFGIVRAAEFMMKDAYSFDTSVENMQKNYQIMYEAYQRIFERLNLDYVITEADSGAMGGDISHEFMVPAEIGEDEVEVNGEKKTCMELGHIFQLGTKYTKALNAVFLDEDGKQQPIIMGCYGIGVSRVIAAIIETHHDDNGIIWPKEVAPFAVQLVPVGADKDDAVRACSDQLHDALVAKNIEVLCDDRPETAGRKFKDADLIGLPVRVTIGKRTLAEGKVEIKKRSDAQATLVDQDQAMVEIEKLLG